MDTVPSSVYGSDFSLMDPTETDSLYMSPAVGTGMHAPWPSNAMPGHLVPGGKLKRPRPCKAKPFGAYDTAGDHCDFSSSYRPFHQDWTTQGTRNTHPDPFVGHRFSFATSDLDANLDSIGEEFSSHSDFPELSPHSDDVFDSWMKDPAFDPCHPPASGFAVGEYPLWDALNPREFGFDGQNVPQRLYEEPSDSIHMCKWRVDGSPCNAFIAPGDNLKHAIAQHLSKAHDFHAASGKATQKCHWLGCAKVLKQESIVRHIHAVHLHVTTACKACGTSFARQDSLQRHLRNSCGACKGK